MDATKDDYSDEDIFKDEASPKDNQILGDLLDSKLTGISAHSGAPSPLSASQPPAAATGVTVGATAEEAPDLNIY